MEAQSLRYENPNSNGSPVFSKGIYGAKPAAVNRSNSNRNTVSRSSLIEGGKFDWRLAYWWVSVMWVLFTYTQSILGVWVMGELLGIATIGIIVLSISVSGAEGVIIAWLTTPQRGLVSKRQEKNLRVGSYIITFWQIAEIGLMYAYQLGGGVWFLWGMAMSTVGMLVTAIFVVKNVIQHSEERQKALEESDTRIEEAIANAKIKSMEARHRLQAKKSIIDIEAQVLKREKMQALNALNTREARDGIAQIGAGRAQAVIAATANNMQNYAIKMLAKTKPVNAPINPRSLNGSKAKK